MKKKYILIGVSFLIIVSGFLFYEKILQFGFRRIVISKLEAMSGTEQILLDSGIRIIFAGTGTPQPDKDRSLPCTAIIANGEFLVFDVGGDAMRQMAALGYPAHRITRVFMTHLHSDHMAGLGSMINQTWNHGRNQNIYVYGPDDSNKLSHSLYPPTSEEYLVGNGRTGGEPEKRRINQLNQKDLVLGRKYLPGVKSMIEGISQAYLPDIMYRGSSVEIPYNDIKYAFAISCPIGDMSTASEAPDYGWGELKTIYTSENGKLVVKAFLVPHYPCFPSYGYRVEYGGRIIVISGDTEKVTYMARYAKNADVLVHEAVNNRSISMITEIMLNEMNNKAFICKAKHFRGAANHHTDVLDVAKIAEQAGVHKIVLTHICPPTPNMLAEKMFIEGIDKYFNGDVILARDGMELYLHLFPDEDR